MTDKLALIESIVNENAVDFRQIVNNVLLEKLSIRLDEEYKGSAKSMFTLAEADETEEELEDGEEEGEEGDEEETAEVSDTGTSPDANTRAARSYGAY